MWKRVEVKSLQCRFLKKGCPIFRIINAIQKCIYFWGSFCECVAIYNWNTYSLTLHFWHNQNLESSLRLYGNQKMLLILPSPQQLDRIQQQRMKCIESKVLSAISLMDKETREEIREEIREETREQISETRGKMKNYQFHEIV